MSTTQLRDATPDDLPAINDIYNHYVLHSTCTYQLEPETLEDRRRWFEAHGDRYPVVVAEIDGRIVGWGSIPSSTPGPATIPALKRASISTRRSTAADWAARCLGISSSAPAAAGFHTIIGGASTEQTASIALQEGPRLRREWPNSKRSAKSSASGWT